jgi:hypothetical protein
MLEARSRIASFIRAAVAALFVYSFLYALSLDIFMIKDARYAAEKWIGQNIPQEATLGLAVWEVYAPRVEGYRTMMMASMSLPRFQALSPKPDFVIVNRIQPEVFTLDTKGAILPGILQRKGALPGRFSPEDISSLASTKAPRSTPADQHHQSGDRDLSEAVPALRNLPFL